MYFSQTSWQTSWPGGPWCC